MFFAYNVKYVKVCLISDFWQDDRWKLCKPFFIVTFQSVYGCGEENITWGNTKDLFRYVVTWFVVFRQWLKLETQACVAKSYGKNAFTVAEIFLPTDKSALKWLQ